MRAAVDAHGPRAPPGMRQPIVYVSARPMMMVITPKMRTAMTATRSCNASCRSTQSRHVLAAAIRAAEILGMLLDDEDVPGSASTATNSPACSRCSASIRRPSICWTGSTSRCGSP